MLEPTKTSVKPESFLAKAGWPTQARFWLEWGSFIAGSQSARKSLP